jgi:endonuclease/exonuclease/phosphatase family metal-dependent hydrolase
MHIRKKEICIVAVPVLMVVLFACPAWAEDDAQPAGKLQGRIASLNVPLQNSRDFGVGSFLLASLSDQFLTFPGASAALPAGRITVMTRNLYVGASFSIMLGASTQDDVGDRAAKIYARILASQFPRRADAIADEIIQTQPDVVGLQEVPLILVRSPGDRSISSRPQPTAVAMDYLRILLDALERRHADYVVAAVVSNTDVTATGRNGSAIRFKDRDVILVRRNLPHREMLVLNAQAKNYDMKLDLRIAANDVNLLRGWCSADVIVRGTLVRIVNTHLEEEYLDLIQSFQANELLTGPLQTSLPVIALGDFNASEKSSTYKNFLKAGFRDSWPMLHPHDEGFSCCEDEDLLNPAPQLKERIDFILYHGSDITVDGVKLVGAHPSDRIASGQWPSDHAGIVATLSIK